MQASLTASGWDNRQVADRHEGFDQVLAVWTGSADLANLDALVTPDYVGFIGSRRRDLARLKTDIEAYRTAAPGVAFSIVPRHEIWQGG